jgi:hypothetical protein
MCGTDFSLIAKFFPTRTRRHIRNKYKKEERSNEERIEEALRNPKKLDIEKFRRLAGLDKNSTPVVIDDEVEGEETEFSILNQMANRPRTPKKAAKKAPKKVVKQTPKKTPKKVKTTTKPTLEKGKDEIDDDE